MACSSRRLLTLVVGVSFLCIILDYQMYYMRIKRRRKRKRSKTHADHAIAKADRGFLLAATRPKTPLRSRRPEKLTLHPPTAPAHGRFAKREIKVVAF